MIANAQTSWDRARRHYEKHGVRILSTPADQWALDPYAWDFEAGLKLTPIEQSLWFDIQAESAVLYPQFPVGRYFVDFGNPVAKVAIECDGAAWHTDKAKDEDRQQAIEALGWTVYRITGSDCNKVDAYSVDDLGIDRVEFGPARLLMREIVRRHGIAS